MCWWVLVVRSIEIDGGRQWWDLSYSLLRVPVGSKVGVNARWFHDRFSLCFGLMCTCDLALLAMCVPSPVLSPLGVHVLIPD